MPLFPKTRLGTYEIVGPLGAGAMGEVYRAKDHRLGREVAVKVLPSEVASSPDRLARFEREARTVAGLNHPNIVTLFSVEDEDGVRFLTMELIEGQTLVTLITSGGLPLSRVLELSIPLTDALVAAHERGVIHRDLKPGNVMVTREGRVKVLDFGLAKIERAEGPAQIATLAATAESPISVEGQVLGTVPYMAPEQLRGETVDARSDLFALGVILYELATGRRPFTGETSIDVSHAILRETPERLTRLRADLPGDLERIVSRCLLKNPRERFQTALDVSNELRRLRRELERGTSDRAPDQVPSIAVLPFVNRSANPEDEYFSDGLADELLNVLATIRGLRVAARTSAFHFKGKDTTIAEVGSALNVASVLEGSVRKAGNRVRIAVQLVKVSDGYHLWSETYDRTLDDIFAVQDDIARSVVKELRTTLMGEEADSRVNREIQAEVAAAARGRGGNAEALRLYMRGHSLVDHRTRQDVINGIECFKQALTLEPEYALAWAGLSRAYAAEALFGWVPFAEGFGRAREAAQRALELEPDLAEGHVRLAFVLMNCDWDWIGAKASIERALELAPGNANVLRVAAILASNLGRLDEAIALDRRAVALDPLSVPCHQNLASRFLLAGQLAEAEEHLRQALQLGPQRAGTRFLLARALLAQGRKREAFVEAEGEPEESFRLLGLALIHHAGGRAHDSDEALRELIEKHAEDGLYQIAQAYAYRGDAEEALKWLERAYTQRDPGLAGMKPDPIFRPLHGDTRWLEFLQKMHLFA